jgi:hypothetical protein
LLEDLSRAAPVEGSSDRVFGLVFAGAFALAAAWPLLHANGPRWWAVGIALVVGLVALLRPALLAGLNRLWTKFGLLLGHVMSPIALAMLFYGVMTPLGLAMRWTRHDPLRLARDAAARSYWQPREPPGPPPESMGQQF